MTNERIQREAKKIRYGVVTVYSKMYKQSLFEVGDLISIKIKYIGEYSHYRVYNLTKDVDGGAWSLKDVGFRWQELQLSDKWIRLLT